MARRRELKSIASGIAAYCVSRNNDIFGYWAIGIIYKLAIRRGVDCLWIDFRSVESLPHELLQFRRLFEDRFVFENHSLSQFIVGYVVEFRFEPYANSSSRGQQARATCLVHIIDDLGRSRTASAVTYCYPHNPRFECKSTRG